MTLLILGFAGAAYAASPRIDLAWTQCYGVTGWLTNRSYTGAANYDLQVSASNVTVDNVGEAYWGHDVVVTIGPNVPDAWRFDPQGCQTANFSEVTYITTAAGASCPGLRNGEDVPVNTYAYNPVTGKAEVEGSDAYAAAGGRIPNPSQLYLLYRFRFPLDEDICPGSLQPLCFHLTKAEFAVGTEPALAYLVFGTPGQFWATWNDAPNSLGCPGATPTQPSTWGRMKGLYR
jgi:hypothetical protein